MNFLHNITWKEFITYLSVVFLIYYAAAICYLVKQWFRNARTAKDKKVTWQPTIEEIKETVTVDDIPDPETPRSDVPVDPDLPEDEDIIIRFGQQLYEIIEANRDTTDKKIIYSALTNFLSAFGELNTETISQPLVAVIQKRFREECNIELSASEIQSIWNNSLQQNTGSVVG